MKNKLGQNFLINNDIAKKEVAYADISKQDTVLEIGPGKGILTQLIAEKAKKVIAIEIDKKLIDNLKDILPDNVELINDDVLKIDFQNISKFNKVVSNLPYQISSPVTFKLLNHNFDLAILIFQKEFGQRIIANKNSNHYSRLSVMVYYKAISKLLEYISKENFKPIPKVDSCVIQIAPRKNPPFEVLNENMFFEITKKLFNNRRKKIKNILIKFYDISNCTVPFLDNRVEELSPKQIGELSNIIFKNNIY